MHYTVYCSVALLRYKLFKYIDIPTATNSSNGFGRTFESCWGGQKFSTPILLNQRIDYVTVTACWAILKIPLVVIYANLFLKPYFCRATILFLLPMHQITPKLPMLTQRSRNWPAIAQMKFSGNRQRFFRAQVPPKRLFNAYGNASLMSRSLKVRP